MTYRELSGPPAPSLEPCPFCGKQPTVNKSSDGYTSIGCVEKGCLQPETYGQIGSRSVEQWNMRRAPSAEGRLREALRIHCIRPSSSDYEWRCTNCGSSWNGTLEFHKGDCLAALRGES